MKIQWTLVGLFVCGIIGVIAGAVALCNYEGHIQAGGALALLVSTIAVLFSVLIDD